MKDIIPAKKESPLLGLTGLGGGVGGNLGGSAADIPYIDDVFSTYLYNGNTTAKSITNGIDNSKGGMVWLKSRSANGNHGLFDTVRGATKYIRTNNSNGENNSANTLSSFDSNGFSIGNDTSVNDNNTTYSSWNFRKQEGFFDIVTYSGNNSASRNISHNLGSIPGLIIIKNTTGGGEWRIWHKSYPDKVFTFTNQNPGGSSNYFLSPPTSTQFTIGNNSEVNGTGSDYVCYLFAGGKSTTDTAVEFDGNDWLSMPISNSDFNYAGGDSLTIECFVKLDSFSPGGQGYNSIVNRWGGSGNYCFGLDVNSSGNLFFYKAGSGGNGTSNSAIPSNEWSHIAVVKDGTTGRFFINGKADGTFSWPDGSSNNSQPLHVGNLGDNNNYPIDGQLANVRITMKQALYQTNFNIPHEITQTSQGALPSNVKLLCCDQSTATGSTVAPSTITATGDPTVTTNNSLFDDTDAYKFGEDEDKPVIRCGEYDGDSSNFPEIKLDWEPSWIMIRRANSGDNWVIWDSTRGIVRGTSGGANGDDNALYPNLNDDEESSSYLEVTPTGFKFTRSSGMVNTNSSTYSYVAIRRPDGYVGKPPEAGTDVFNVTLGNASATIPSLVSTFPVDFCIYKDQSSSANWATTQRLTGTGYLKTNNYNSEAATIEHRWDSNVGCHAATWFTTNFISHLWKRHTGFDVVAYRGNGTAGREIQHSMNNTVEMIWIKNRDGSAEADRWVVGVNGLNGGTNPWTKFLALNEAWGEDDNTMFNDTAPTSRAFTVGDHTGVNDNNENYIAMLFSSVTGISKIGSYTGNGQTLSNGPYITTGFQPRYIILKSTSNGSWFVFDSVRGFGTPGQNTISLKLDTNSSSNGSTYVDPDATGFRVVDDSPQVNGSGVSYIYYAHA